MFLPADDIMKRRILLLKVLALFFGLTLSLYAPSLWSLWMFFLIAL